MLDNPVVVIVFLVLGGIVGVLAFFRNPIQALLVNYPTWIVSKAVKFIPALAVFMSEQTTIQQEPARRPDDHLVSASKSTDVPLTGESRLRIATFTSSIEATLRPGEFDPWIRTVSHLYYVKSTQVAAILAADQERQKH